jgi:hypothetical protein
MTKLTAAVMALVAATNTVFTAAAAESPSAPAASQRQALFGDLHLHTTQSFDAYVMLGTRVTPDEAYRFAKGETVTVLGQPVRRAEPLDFLAVTDHSENMGVFNSLDDANSELSRSAIGQKVKKDGPKAFWDVIKLTMGGKSLPVSDTKPLIASAWQREIDAANHNYQPGKFTTFIAYEWSSMPSGKYNLHRNVIFSGDKAPLPFSSLDSNKPEDLWTYLESVRKAGYEALAIPHNANASNGLMYDWVDSYGRPIDEAYALRRAANEPLSEISQNKGQSETHPALSPNDEFANFEVFDHLLIGGTKSDPPGSYVRDAYGRGLTIEHKVGVNPYKFGVVGASDFHNGLSTSAENAYGGSIGGIDPKQPPPEDELAKTYSGDGAPDQSLETILFASGNLTGVWAEENTRESIYAALRRKETFATSGTRLQLRFFGGWDYAPGLLKSSDWVRQAYAAGVPLGGDLPARPASSKAPSFIISALKDPNGANLDRAQVIKVWLDGEKYQEKIFDVALSDRRKVDAKTGRAPPLRNTVNLKTASYTNSVGATQFSTVWTDPEFNSSAAAVYYLRVIEIATPRWSTILAVRRHSALPATVPASVQERGWSSPIWYSPAKSVTPAAAAERAAHDYGTMQATLIED